MNRQAVTPPAGDWLRRAEQDPVVTVSVEVSVPMSPMSVYAALSGHEGTCLLETTDPSTGELLSTLIGAEPWGMLLAKGPKVEWRGPDVPGFKPETPLASLRTLLACLGGGPQPSSVVGLGAGYLSYDSSRELLALNPAQAKGLDVWDVAVTLPSLVVRFDHTTAKVVAEVRTPVLGETVGEPSYEAAANQLIELVERVTSAPVWDFHHAGVPGPLPAVNTTPSAEDYETSLTQALDQVRSGAVRQLGPSRRYSIPCDASPLQVYAALREHNRSPYMFLLEMPGVALAGCSPQDLVRVNGDQVQISAIAGTQRRLPDRDDVEVEQELLASDKERRELQMLVDAAVDELAAVADPDSIVVPPAPELRRLKTLVHMATTVAGTLKPGVSGVDALFATLPAGTVVGAPKLGAMRLVDGLEPERRGPYGGCVGRFDSDGGVEACITIRTCVLTNGEAHVQAGAGVVEGSSPVAEREESEAKASAVLAAVAGAGGVK